MKKEISSIFFIYELGHVDELKKYFEKNPEENDHTVVIAFSLDIEERLQKIGITFISFGIYKRIFIDQLSNEDDMITKFFSDSRWKEFMYRDIYIPKIFQFMFRAYLQGLRYYAMQIVRIVESYPEIKEIKLFPPSEVISKTYGTLASREIHTILDCSKRIGEIRGIKISVIPASIVLTSFRNSMRPIIFSFKRNVFSYLLKIWNTFIIIFVRPRHPRLLISDHWKNIEGSIRLLKHAECIFLDRTEIRHINWRLLLRYRMRFVHSTDFLSWGARRKISENSKRLRDAWVDMRKDFPEIFVWEGYSFDPLLLNAVEDITLDFPRILSEIEGTYAMYKKLKPDIVELRASVSKQTHFSILPLVAKKCGIPSLELQHGLEYLGPGSWSREHAAEYIAVYGSLVKKELISLGHGQDKLIEIGSPRFDKDVIPAAKNEMIHKHEKFTIFCIAPDIRAFEIYDSYSALDYFTHIAHAAEEIKEKVHIIIKLRPGPADETILRRMIEKAFSGFSYSIAQYEPLGELYKKADVVISCFSTVILEALQWGKPVIIPALHPIDAQVVRFHFTQYSEAEALFVVFSEQEFAKLLFLLFSDPKKRDEISEKIRIFMTRNFRFDGKSNERYANLMVKLAKKN